MSNAVLTSRSDHKQVCSLRTRGTLYCYKLMHEQVPAVEARSIAVALARYDAYQQSPSPAQQTLIMKFSAAICRAKLWRPRMLG